MKTVPLMAIGLVLALLGAAQAALAQQSAFSHRENPEDSQPQARHTADCNADPLPAPKKAIRCEIKADLSAGFPLLNGQKWFGFSISLPPGGTRTIPVIGKLFCPNQETTTSEPPIKKRVVIRMPDRDTEKAAADSGLWQVGWSQKADDNQCPCDGDSACPSDHKVRIVEYVIGQKTGMDVDVTVDSGTCDHASGCTNISGGHMIHLGSMPFAGLLKMHTRPTASNDCCRNVNTKTISASKRNDCGGGDGQCCRGSKDCACGDDGPCGSGSDGANNAALISKMARLQMENAILRAHEKMRSQFARETETLKQQLFEARLQNAELLAAQDLFQQRQDILNELAGLHARNAELAAQAHFQEQRSELIREFHQARAQSDSSGLQSHLQALTGEMEKIRSENQSLRARMAELTDRLHLEARPPSVSKNPHFPVR